MEVPLNNIKILFMVYSLSIGGAEKQAFYLAKYLKNHGANVKVCALMKGDGKLKTLCENSNIECILREYQSRSKIAGFIYEFLKYFLFLLLVRPQILLTYTITPNVFGGILWKICGIKLFVWNQRDEGISRFKEPFQRIAVNNTKYFFANSKGASLYLENKLKIPSKRILEIRNALNTNPPLKSREEWRALIGIDEKTIVAGNLANLSLSKNQIQLIYLWKKILNNWPENKVKPVMLFAGRKDEAFQNIKAEIKIANLQDTIKILGPIDDVMGFLSSIDIFVFSSPSEGCPNAVIEAMQSKLPIFALDILAIRQLIADENERYLFKSFYEENCKKGLLELMNCEEERKNIGNANYFKIMRTNNEYNTLGRIKNILVKIYEK